MKTFPLKKEIVFCDSGDSDPEYLTPESKVLDLSKPRKPAQDSDVESEGQRQDF